MKRVSRRAAVLALAALSVLPRLAPAAGAVKLDGRVGSAGKLTLGKDSLGRYIITPDHGRVVGGRHAFYSFEKLDLDPGSEARFVGPTSFKNVIARVSGGASTIDGKLSVRLGAGQLGTGPNVNPRNTANFWLVNPAGITFGGNSSFDVKGAVIISTAGSVNVPDRLVTTDTSVDDGAGLTLRVSPIGSFGFGDRPASVVFGKRPQQANISDGSKEVRFGVRDESVFSVVAGDILIDRARVGSQRGRVNAVSVGSGGTVTFDATSLNARDPVLTGFRSGGSITLRSHNPDDRTDTLVETARLSAGGIDGDGFRNDGSPIPDGATDEFASGNRVGGRVVIRGGRLILISRVVPTNDPKVKSGDDARILANNDRLTPGEIASNGNADPSMSGAVVERPGIDIELSDELVVGAGARVECINQNAARGADIRIVAKSLDVLNGGRVSTSVVRERQEPPNAQNFKDLNGRGDAGNILIETPTGRVRLDSPQPTIDDSGQLNRQSDHISTISARVDDSVPTSMSRTGNIVIRAESLQIGLISLITNTGRGAGDGGIIDVETTGDVTIGNPTEPFEVFLADGTPANRKFQVVKIGRLVNGEEITESAAPGVALPDVTTITAGDLRTNGGTPGISSRSQPTGFRDGKVVDVPGTVFMDASGKQVGAGNAGIIHIHADGSVRLLAGGQVNSESNAMGGEAVTQGSSTRFRFIRNAQGEIKNRGAAGAIAISAGELIDIRGSASGVKVASRFSRGGPAGNITLNAPEISLTQGAQIEATTRSPFDGGRITLAGVDGARADEITLSSGGQIRTSSLTTASGNAGAILLRAGDLSLTEDLSLPEERLVALVNAGGQTTIKSTTSTAGGNVLLADDTQQFKVGNAGRVDVEAGNFSIGDWTQVSVNATAFIQASGVPSYPKGAGGSMRVVVDDTLRVSGHVARLEAATEGSGAGGKIDLTARRIELVDGGQIRASSSPRAGARKPTDPPPGDAGDLNITSNDAIIIDGIDPLRPTDTTLQAGLITASSGGAGGEITIRGPAKILVSSGKITTTGSKTGGDINIGRADVDLIPGTENQFPPTTPEMLDANSPSVAVGDGGRIVADADQSFAGNIRIFLAAGGAYTQSVLGKVSARSAAGEQFDGVIDITSPEKSFAAELIRLNGELKAPDAFLQKCCELKRTRDLSSFTLKPAVAPPLDPAGWMPVR